MTPPVQRAGSAPRLYVPLYGDLDLVDTLLQKLGHVVVAQLIEQLFGPLP